MVVPLIFQDDTAEDRKVIQPKINQIVMYPLAKFDGKMKTIDWSKAPSFSGANDGSGETQWVAPEKFFDQLGDVLDGVPPMPGEEAMYASFRALLKTAEKDPEIKKVLVETAIETDKEVVSKFLRWKYNDTPAGNNWNRSTQSTCCLTI